MLITDQVATAPCTDPIQERLQTFEVQLNVILGQGQNHLAVAGGCAAFSKNGAYSLNLKVVPITFRSPGRLTPSFWRR